MKVHAQDAVSPVIGVILMVAITVILAAVIAAFVFGMTETMNQAPYAGVTVKQVADDILITYAAAPPTGERVTNITVRLDGEMKDGWWMTDPTVGESLTLEGEGTSAPDHVVVTAVFEGGMQSVIMDVSV